MNTLFTRQIRPTEQPEEETPRQVTVFVENPKTNTFGFVLKSKARPGVSPELTLQDKKELAGMNIGNLPLAAKAKAIYAAGGGITEIAKQCNISPSYAKKLHMAFGRFKNGQNAKRSKRKR